MDGGLPEQKCSRAETSCFHFLGGLSKSLNPSEPGVYNEDSKLDCSTVLYGLLEDSSLND